jgi:hypothetical protein
LPRRPPTGAMPTPLKVIARVALYPATAFARNGLKQANAPLANSAPGQRATQMTIVAGAMPAKAKEKVNGKEKGKVPREGLPHLTLAVAHRPKSRKENVVPPLQVESLLLLLLLLASEVSLLQVKLTSLLALDS